MAGKPILSDGRRGLALVGVIGDWMWAADTCALQQNYRKKRGPICHRCGATVEGECNYSDFRDGARHFCIERFHADYMSAPTTAHAPITETPGFHIQSVFPELMHGGPLGYCLTASGSCLKELCDEAVFAHRVATGTWLEKLYVQLSAASADFKAWCKLNKVDCSHPRFTPQRDRADNEKQHSVFTCQSMELSMHHAMVGGGCRARGGEVVVEFVFRRQGGDDVGFGKLF